MREVEICSIAGPPVLQVRRLRNSGPPVLYVHGATFPSALSIGFCFRGGKSWEEHLRSEGFDVWSFDFAGFGGSERRSVTSSSLAAGRAKTAAQQIARVIGHIRVQCDDSVIKIIAHSWGSLAAGCYLENHNHFVDRLVLFGPIARRLGEKTINPEGLPATRLITVAAQLERFISDVPEGEGTLLADPELTRWGPAYLASDPAALTREPPAVEVPAGPAADIAAAWQGDLAYDPGRIAVPTLLVRGEWDSLCQEEDARSLLASFGSAVKRDLVVPRATHLMHLESGRFELWKSVTGFLRE